VKECCSSPDSEQHINIAWLCILEDSARVEETIKVHDMLTDNKIPIIVVITKSEEDKGFSNIVRQKLPHAKNVVRVRVLSKLIDGKIQIPPMGLSDLLKETLKVVPLGKENALISAQNIDVDLKKSACHKTIHIGATASAAVGLSPIPFSDAALLIPIQAVMIVGITFIFFPSVNFTSVTSGVLSTILSPTLTTITGKFVVSNLLKFIPGIGSITGAVISGSAAFALTELIGNLYLKVIETIYDDLKHPNINVPIDEEIIISRFQKEIQRHFSHLS
jgi:uncharacterized protein (DUF697 family)